VALNFERMSATGHQMWRFKCDCGAIFVTQGNGFVRGLNKSCGCLRKERNSRGPMFRHGLADTPTHIVWQNMRYRCRSGYYKVKVCRRWELFENFLVDMGERPSSKHSIDRKNNELGYFKSNCRWATAREQARNRRNNVTMIFRGARRTLTEVAEIIGVRSQLIFSRINQYGWTIEDAVYTPARGGRYGRSGS
jgi:hypothetical protein